MDLLQCQLQINSKIWSMRFTRVTDPDIGLSENDIRNIFDRFYQLSPIDITPKDGSSIGLVIIKELVQLMSGTIEISSKLDIGTMITICLPRTNWLGKTSSNKDSKIPRVEKNDLEAKYYKKEGVSTYLDTYQGKEREFLIQLNKIVSDELHNSELNVSFVCKKLHISRTQLHRKIKALTNKSITAYIRGIRLYMAKRLILNSTLTIQQIAYDTGFSDPSYFHRVFVKEFENSPGYFRK